MHTRTHTHSSRTHTHSSAINRSNIRSRIHKYNTKKKILKTYSNLKKFNKFYKKISSIEKKTITGYKNTDYIAINKYLYDDNNIKEFSIDEWEFGNYIKTLYSNDTKELFNYKNISLDKLPKFIELYVNKFIINKIHILDKLFTNKEISKLNGDEILFRGTSGHAITTNKSKVGDSIIFNSFSSTSTNKDVSTNFINKLNKKHTLNNTLCCLYILQGLKDVPYIYIPWSNVMKSQLKSSITISLHDEFEYLLPRNLKFKIKKIETIIADDISYSNPITFEKLDKIMKHTKTNNLYKKINKKIKVYHLDFVEQLPVLPLAPYTYNSNINLHLDKISLLHETTNCKHIFVLSCNFIELVLSTGKLRKNNRPSLTQ